MTRSLGILAAAAFAAGLLQTPILKAQEPDAPSPDVETPQPSAEAAPVEGGAVQLSSPIRMPVPAEPEPEAQPAPEPLESRSNPGTRARLAVWQTVFGATYALEVCALAECDSVRGGIGAVLIGMGAGTATSLLATRRRGIEPRQATLYNTAPLMGSFVAYELFAIAGQRDPAAPGDRSPLAHEKAVLGSILAAQLGSYGVAYGVDRLLRPTSGDIVFAESASLWLTSLTTLAIWDARGLGDNTQVRRAHAGYLTATLGGLVGGGLLAHRYGISAPRTMVVNAGGILGGGVGMLVGFFILGEHVVDHTHAVAWSLIGGSVGGMALSMGLTRGLDHRRRWTRDLTMGLSPAYGGGATVQLAMRLP